MQTVKIDPQLSDSVAETLMITLAMKCKETKHKHRVFYDPKSCEMMDKLMYDFSKYKGGIASAAGVVVRAKDFDNVAQDFILQHKQPVIVIVGCGLDTRYHRISQKKNAIFYELDLPEVIELRRKLLPEEEQHFIKSSMFDTAWMDSVKAAHPQGEFLFLIEGVLMYFKESQVKSFIQNLAKRFAGGLLYIDVLSSWMSRRTKNHDTVRKTNAKFQWGLDDLARVENWAPNIKFVKTFYFITQSKGHWPILQFFMKLIPKMRGATRNAMYRFT